MKNVACFFMLCTERTEEECLRKSLFGDREWKLPDLKLIKNGDIGFLINVSRNQLIGLFQAVSPAQLNIDKEAWGGEFPAQVKVKSLGPIQRVNNASEQLGKILTLKKVHNYYIPRQNTYGPDITEQVLSLFRTSDDTVKLPEGPVIGKSISETYELDNIAGLTDVKEFIFQRIIAPFEDEEIAHRLSLRIGGGMLLFGPPGTGKTMISMAVARSIDAKFIDISPSVIIGYPGEAEKRLENLFAALDKEPRAVVFLDEAEWILCKREDQTSSVMQRITPVLLAQLSRIFRDRTKPIVIIAATNKPEMIDPAFLRPGRFDKIFYIGLPDQEARKEILKIHLRNRDNQLGEEDLVDIAKRLEGYSGADIEHIIEESAFRTFERRKEGAPMITKEDILQVIEKTPKSVTHAEIERFKNWAEQRGIPLEGDHGRLQ